MKALSVLLLKKRLKLVGYNYCRGGETGNRTGFRTQQEKSFESSNLSRGIKLTPP